MVADFCTKLIKKGPKNFFPSAKRALTFFFSAWGGLKFFFPESGLQNFFPRRRAVRNFFFSISSGPRPRSLMVVPLARSEAVQYDTQEQHHAKTCLRKIFVVVIPKWGLVGRALPSTMGQKNLEWLWSECHNPVHQKEWWGPNCQSGRSVFWNCNDTLDL